MSKRKRKGRERPNRRPRPDAAALARIARVVGEVQGPGGGAADPAPVLVPLRDDYADVNDLDGPIERAGLRVWVRAVLSCEWPPGVGELPPGMPPPSHVLVRVLAPGVRLREPVEAHPLCLLN